MTACTEDVQFSIFGAICIADDECEWELPRLPDDGDEDRKIAEAISNSALAYEESAIHAETVERRVHQKLAEKRVKRAPRAAAPRPVEAAPLPPMLDKIVQQNWGQMASGWMQPPCSGSRGPLPRPHQGKQPHMVPPKHGFLCPPMPAGWKPGDPLPPMPAGWRPGDRIFHPGDPLPPMPAGWKPDDPIVLPPMFDAIVQRNWGLLAVGPPSYPLATIAESTDGGLVLEDPPGERRPVKNKNKPKKAQAGDSPQPGPPLPPMFDAIVQRNWGILADADGPPGNPLATIEASLMLGTADARPKKKKNPTRKGKVPLEGESASEGTLEPLNCWFDAARTRRASDSDADSTCDAPWSTPGSSRASTPSRSISVSPTTPSGLCTEMKDAKLDDDFRSAASTPDALARSCFSQSFLSALKQPPSSSGPWPGRSSSLPASGGSGVKDHAQPSGSTWGRSFVGVVQGAAQQALADPSSMSLPSRTPAPKQTWASITKACTGASEGTLDSRGGLEPKSAIEPKVQRVKSWSELARP